jgi:diadenylate cyclase
MLQVLANMANFESSWLLTLFDVVIVAFLIYRSLLVIRGTRALPMLWGLIVVTLVYLAARQVGLQTLSWVLGNFLSSIILVIVVVFQDEIRRALTKVGLQRIFVKENRTVNDKLLEDLTILSRTLSEQKTGALLVLQRSVGLAEFIEDAVPIDALLNRKLLAAIFMKSSPLHDGAVVIRGNRIKAAGCVLPLSFNPDLDPSLGTRHRAALGISERSDALAIVVSEENGSLSLAAEGRLTRNLTPAELRDELHRRISNGHDTESETHVKGARA